MSSPGELLSEESLFRRWRNRWRDFLERVDGTAGEDRVADALRDKVIIGNAERKIAGGHEGREILELLQNARDAIRAGSDDSGRVHVGVHDEGVLVANTGSRFDFFDEDVENAVTMIGETGKGSEDDDQSIGHKGVGLKSILATGDAFDIYTRPDRESEEILGVRLSRAYLLSAVLQEMGHDAEVAGASSPIVDDGLVSLLNNPVSDSRVDLTDDLRTDLSKLPLFNFPVPIDVDATGDDPIADRARRLLRGEGSRTGPDQDEPFRTVVFVRYRDDQWRSLLDRWDVPLPEEETRGLEDRPDRIWDYLSGTESAGGLQPETVVQLDYIDRLDLERTAGRGENPKTEHWSVERQASSDVGTPGLAHDTVSVSVATDRDRAPEFVTSFDQFRFEPRRDHGVQVLIEKRDRSRTGREPSESYPLYLFYPVQNTATVSFPFCLHGRFRVETNRKDLSTNNLGTNRAVLEEGLDLLEAVATETASASLTDADRYGDRYPWVLLPPVPDTQVSDPSTQAELLEWFSSALFDRLSDTDCVPTTAESVRTPRETLLHWRQTVLDGYRAYLDLCEELDRPTDPEADVRPIPDRSALLAYEQFDGGWTRRLRELLSVEEEAGVTETVAAEWARTLSETLARNEDSPPAVTCSATPGREFFVGTVELLVGSASDDRSLEAVIADLAETMEGTYLLPCRIREGSQSDRLLLTQLERRGSPEAGQRRTSRARSVIWDVGSTDRGGERPPAPPQQSNFTVYFLDEGVQEYSAVHQVLNEAGREWGLRAYEGIPSFYRSLLDTFASGGRETIEPRDFGFLASLIDRIGSESSDLQFGEGAFFPRSYLKSAITQTEGDRRQNLRRRVDLRTAGLELPNDDVDRHLDRSFLTDNWQRLLVYATSNDADETVGEDWASVDTESIPAPDWPDPKTDAWDGMQTLSSRSISWTDIVRTLSLLGASAVPNVRIVWMYDDHHPPMQQSPPWDPVEWDESSTVESGTGRLDSLRAVLEHTDNQYQRFVTGPGFHPGDTGDHSTYCSVATNHALQDVNLASWVWLDEPDRWTAAPNALRELLRRHDGAYIDSLLTTGWSCDYNHKRRAWSTSVPSLLNWQLRHLPVWDPLVSVDDELEDQWAVDAETLRYTVRVGSSRGAQAGRMFPHVTDDDRSAYSDSVLEVLGVKTVSALNATEAADHLQRLLETVADSPLAADRTTSLTIPSERTNDWNQAYTRLLEPLLDRLPESPSAEYEPDWPFLTHLPLRDGESWIAAPIDWIRDHADRIRYYEDQSPKPWERQEVESEEYLVLPRPSGGPFTRLADTLGVEKVDASKLVLDAGTVEFVTDRHTASLDSIQGILQERRDLLVASTERTDEEQVRETADEIRAAARDLAVAAEFPDRARNQLSDASSALYRTEDGTDALLLNEHELDGEEPEPADLAMGVALLVERPTKVATFREALRSDETVRDLEDRWAHLTFPIETVKELLGSQATRRLESRLEALSSLLEAFTGSGIEHEEAVLGAVSDGDPELLEAVVESFRTGSAIDGHRELSDRVRSLGPSVCERLPDELHPFVDLTFDETAHHGEWIRTLESADLTRDRETTVVQWLHANRRLLPSHPFDAEVRARYTRLLALHSAFRHTETEELIDVDTWRRRTEDFSGGSPEDLPWIASLPDTLASELECPPRLVHLTQGDRLETLTGHVLATIEDGTTASEDVLTSLEAYLTEGRFPDTVDTGGAKDHQQAAFSDIAGTIQESRETSFGGLAGTSSDGGVIDLNNEQVGGSSDGVGGGGSTQYRGRGQQAEVYVMATVLDRMAEWVEDSPGNILQEFRRRFKRLRSEQAAAGYKWHVGGAWEDLEPVLDDPARLTSDTAENWRELVRDGTPLWDLDVIQLINVTLERGPGYDVIDPFGPETADGLADSHGLAFTPVEIKAVGGATPPFRFRLTTNEYRRCKAFVRDSDHVYTVRLVSVPEPDTPDWPAHTSVVAERVIDSVSTLENQIADRGFEEVVKGGYMNIELQE